MTTATTLVNERIAKRFKLYDTDRDGVIRCADLENEALSIVQAFGESESSEKGAAIRDSYLNMWDFIADTVGVDRMEPVTLQQFTDFVQEQILESGATEYFRVLLPTIEAILELADTDGNGQLSLAEFTRWLDAMGVDRNSAELAFRILDIDEDGQLNTFELREAMRMYYEGKLDAPLLGH